MKTYATLSFVLAIFTASLQSSAISPKPSTVSSKFFAVRPELSGDTPKPKPDTRRPTADTLTPAPNAQKQPGDFALAIEKVVHDFPDNFSHITGDLVLAQGEIENYTSVVELPGATSCTITKYHSHEDTTASWQARIYQGDHFGEASRKYSELYGKLKNCTLQLPDGGIVYMRGEWISPKEESPFTTSTLRLLSGDERYKYMKIEIELVYQVTDWIINLNIMSKKPDDELGKSAGD